MSIDAIALLPPLELPSPGELEDGWLTVNLPEVPAFPFKPLKDGTLAMLGLPFAYPDEDLYKQCASWMSLINGYRPGRIWVFPDTAVPDFPTSTEMLNATREAGRWVSAPRGKLRPASDFFGLTRAEAKQLLNDMMSGDDARIDAAKAHFEKRMSGHSEAELKEMLDRFLKQR